MIFQVEIRFDIEAVDVHHAHVQAHELAKLIPDSRVTGVFDDEWNEV